MSYGLPSDQYELPLAGEALANVAAAPGAWATYRLSQDTYIWGMRALVTTLVVGPLVPPAGDLCVADCDGVTNLAVVTTLTIPNLTPVGTVLGSRVAAGPYFVRKGRAILLRHTVAAAGSGASGAVLGYVILTLAGRDPGDVSF